MEYRRWVPVKIRKIKYSSRKPHPTGTTFINFVCAAAICVCAVLNMCNTRYPKCFFIIYWTAYDMDMTIKSICMHVIITITINAERILWENCDKNTHRMPYYRMRSVCSHCVSHGRVFFVLASLSLSYRCTSELEPSTGEVKSSLMEFSNMDAGNAEYWIHNNMFAMFNQTQSIACASGNFIATMKRK